jgi:hypothetical protein
MSKFPELTEAQREPLFRLVKHQREAKEELRFRFMWEIPKPQGIYQIYSDAVKWPGPNQPPVAEADEILMQLWRELGYIQLHSRPVRGSPHNAELLLRKRALDYEKRESSHWLVRGVANKWDEWGPEWRAGLIALIVAFLTALILNRLGL